MVAHRSFGSICVSFWGKTKPAPYLLGIKNYKLVFS